MSKKDITKDYLKKLKILDKYNKHYYENSKPIVDDQKYDLLKEEILKLETNYNFLKSQKSASNSVGYRPSKNFQKVLHRVPMLSLSNAFSRDDLINFEKKIRNFTLIKENEDITYSA